MCLFRKLAVGIVPDIALDDFLIVHHVDVTDELHCDPSSIGGFERQVFIPDIFFPLQFFEVVLVGDDILERPDLPDFLTQELFAREAQHGNQKWIYIDNLTGLGIKNQYPVLCRLKKPTIPHLGSMHCIFRLFALGDIMGNGRNTDQTVLCISDLGCIQDNIDPPAIFLPAHGFVTDDRFAVPDPFKN